MTGRYTPPRRNPAAEQLTAILGPLEGARIPGGCDHCDAYQTPRPEQVGVWVITVHHDDWCPTLKADQTRRRTS